MLFNISVSLLYNSINNMNVYIEYLNLELIRWWSPHLYKSRDHRISLNMCAPGRCLSVWPETSKIDRATCAILGFSDVRH